MENKTVYTHKVQYYETDKMGITHHSNYVRWMEEARVDFLSKAGLDYAALEAEGLISAVVKISCDFRHPTTFPEEISIYTAVEEFKGATFVFAYKMENSGGTEAFSGRSVHAFLGSDGRPVNVKKKFPEIYEKLMKLAPDGTQA